MVDLLKVLLGVAALAAGNIHHMQQQAAALHMAQEVMAQTNAIGSTFDQAGDIGADKALFRANAHNAQNGGQRGKVIVCNFGACRADGADQGGLAHIGEADQANVRDHFQFQSQVHILTGQAGLGKARDLTGGGGKAGITPTAAAAFGHNNRGIAGKIRHDQAGLGFFQHGAAGHADDQVVSVLAFLAGTAAIFAIGGGILALITEIHQGGQVWVRLEHDVAAAAAIAAVRAASRDELFAVEADRAIAALAGVQPDGCDINKITGTGHVLPPLGGVAITKRIENKE